MDIKLFLNAISKFVLGIVIVGILIFLPAGSLSFFNGWLLMCILFIPMFIAGIILMVKNPNLLKKRLNIKDNENKQNIVIKLSGLMFIVGFILSGLGFRFKWYTLPRSIVIISAFIFLVFYILYAEVLRENSFLSRTIDVQENQKVIETGLYSVVRHPMYSITLFLFLSIPLVLGSLYAFFIFLLYPFIIAYRIKQEEKLLEKKLYGYSEYKKKVKYRLIPFIW